MKTFKEYIKTTEPIVIKKPDQCSEYELILFHQMLIKSGLTKITMDNIIRRGQFLGFYYDGTELSAVAAVKDAMAAKFVFQKAGVEDKMSHYKYEVGWSFVEQKYRSQGINAKLLDKLLQEVHNVPTFCTVKTENTVAVAAYQKLGFEMLGDPFYYSGDSLVILMVKDK